MIVKDLKEILNKLDDNLEVYIRNSVNPCGNISDLYQVEKSTYGFFGTSCDCIILNTFMSKKLKTDENDEVIPYIEEDN